MLTRCFTLTEVKGWISLAISCTSCRTCARMCGSKGKSRKDDGKASSKYSRAATDCVMLTGIPESLPTILRVGTVRAGFRNDDIAFLSDKECECSMRSYVMFFSRRAIRRRAEQSDAGEACRVTVGGSSSIVYWTNCVFEVVRFAERPKCLHLALL